ARRVFPLRADVSQEAAAAGTGLVEERIAPVSVEPDGGRREEDLRLVAERTDRSREECGSPHATVQNEGLPRSRPSARRDALAGQVHDGIDALEGPMIQRAVVGIPPRRIRAGSSSNE